MELFNKSLVINFRIDKIFTEPENESEIHTESILLFPPIYKQEISPSQSFVLFNSSSLICHRKEHEKKGKKRKEGNKYAPRRIFQTVLKSLTR